MKRYKVIILPSAYDDIKQARVWYRQHNAILPKRFSQQIHLAVERISSSPFIHTMRYEKIRIANLNTFPYAIHYLIEDTIIIIIGVYHTAISPAKWKDRI